MAHDLSKQITYTIDSYYTNNVRRKVQTESEQYTSNLYDTMLGFESTIRNYQKSGYNVTILKKYGQSKYALPIEFCASIKNTNGKEFHLYSICI